MFPTLEVLGKSSSGTVEMAKLHRKQLGVPFTSCGLAAADRGSELCDSAKTSVVVAIKCHQRVGRGSPEPWSWPHHLGVSRGILEPRAQSWIQLCLMGPRRSYQAMEPNEYRRPSFRAFAETQTGAGTPCGASQMGHCDVLSCPAPVTQLSTLSYILATGTSSGVRVLEGFA